MYILTSTLFILFVVLVFLHRPITTIYQWVYLNLFTIYRPRFYAYLPLNGNMIFSLDWNPEYLLSLFLYKLPLVVMLYEFGRTYLNSI